MTQDITATELQTFYRLVDDANFAWKANRIDSSIIQSTMAIEQAGKILLKRQKLKGTDHHIKKQKAAAALITAMLFMDGIENSGFEVVRISELNEFQQQFVDKVNSDAELKSDFYERVGESMNQSVKSWSHNHVLARIQEGWIFRLRNDVLYGEEYSGASEDEKKMIAEALISMCDKLIAFMKRTGSRNTPNKNVSDGI